MTRRQRYERITRELAEPGTDTARLVQAATVIEERWNQRKEPAGPEATEPAGKRRR